MSEGCLLDRRIDEALRIGERLGRSSQMSQLLYLYRNLTEAGRYFSSAAAAAAAAALARSGSERRFLEKRARECTPVASGSSM